MYNERGGGGGKMDFEKNYDIKQSGKQPVILQET